MDKMILNGFLLIMGLASVRLAVAEESIPKCNLSASENAEKGYTCSVENGNGNTVQWQLVGKTPGVIGVGGQRLAGTGSMVWKDLKRGLYITSQVAFGHFDTIKTACVFLENNQPAGRLPQETLSGLNVSWRLPTGYPQDRNGTVNEEGSQFDTYDSDLVTLVNDGISSVVPDLNESNWWSSSLSRRVKLTVSDISRHIYYGLSSALKIDEFMDEGGFDGGLGQAVFCVGEDRGLPRQPRPGVTAPDISTTCRIQVIKSEPKFHFQAGGGNEQVWVPGGWGRWNQNGGIFYRGHSEIINSPLGGDYVFDGRTETIVSIWERREWPECVNGPRTEETGSGTIYTYLPIEIERHPRN